MSTARAFFLVAVFLCAAATAHADPRTDAPETPTRTDVQAAMNAVSGAVSACGRGGTVTVSVEFGSDGRVRDATARGSVGGADIAGTDIERCIVAAARTAVLPIFRRATYRVNYPFRL